MSTLLNELRLAEKTEQGDSREFLKLCEDLYDKKTEDLTEFVTSIKAMGKTVDDIEKPLSLIPNRRAAAKTLANSVGSEDKYVTARDELARKTTELEAIARQQQAELAELARKVKTHKALMLAGKQAQRTLIDTASPSARAAALAPMTARRKELEKQRAAVQKTLADKKHKLETMVTRDTNSKSPEYADEIAECRQAVKTLTAEVEGFNQLFQQVNTAEAEALNTLCVPELI